MSTKEINRLKPGTPVTIAGKPTTLRVEQIEHTSCRNTHPCRIRLRDAFHNLFIASPEEITLGQGVPQ